MKKRFTSHGRLIGTCVVMLTAAQAGGGMFSMYFENDSRYLKPNGATDRHYTHGTKLVYSTEPDWQWLMDFSESSLFSQPASVAPAVGFFLGQNIYTPDHADEPSRRGDKEHVFAGWLYTGLFVQRRQADLLDHFELNVGMVGPSARAHRTQHCIHQVLRSGRPVGWDEQIGDEPAADVTWVRRQRQTGGWLAPTDYTDVITDFGFTAGSLHRHIEAGVMLRCGVNLPDDFGPGRLELPSSAAAMDLQNTRSVYVFARLSGRAVQHDRFLTGLTPRPLTGRAQVGLACRWDDIELAYMQTFMTETFKEQSRPDSYGAITLTMVF